MKKFFDKEGKEVKFGDWVFNTTENKQKSTYLKTTLGVTLSPENYKGLLDIGVITMKETEGDITVASIIESFASYLGKSLDDTCKFLYTVYSVNTSSLYTMVLKKIAIKLDSKYEGHIKDSKKLYFIDTISGCIVSSILPKTRSINWSMFSAFRTKEDAKEALCLTNKLISYLEEHEA